MSFFSLHVLLSIGLSHKIPVKYTEISDIKMAECGKGSIGFNTFLKHCMKTAVPVH